MVVEFENKHKIFQRVGILPIPLVTSYIIATNEEAFKEYLTYTSKGRFIKNRKQICGPSGKQQAWRADNVVFNSSYIEQNT